MKSILLAGALLAATSACAQTEPTTAYIFTYFEGEGPLKENLHFAVSDNGFDWKALNANKPVVMADTISVSGGLRDPHILRSEDSKSYMIVATDMSTVRNGWKENPGIVMLRSDDMVNWTHSAVHLSKAFPAEFGDAYWVWAPQTIYDPEAGKYMVYFTVRRQDESKGLVTYYAYANKDFTAFESAPQVLFNTENGCIDNDIVKGPDGLWYMFFKDNENLEKHMKGIKYATSKSLHGPWEECGHYVDAYAGHPPVEGSGVFKLNDSDEYVLMYDLYTSKRYEYQTSKDLKTFSDPKPFTKDFAPRHGTVMPITASELTALKSKWGK